MSPRARLTRASHHLRAPGGEAGAAERKTPTAQLGGGLPLPPNVAAPYPKVWGTGRDALTESWRHPAPPADTRTPMRKQKQG